MTIKLYHSSDSNEDRKLGLTIDESGLSYYNQNGDLVFSIKYSDADKIILDERYHCLIEISLDFATFEFDPFFDGDYSENIELIKSALKKYANAAKLDLFEVRY